MSDHGSALEHPEGQAQPDRDAYQDDDLPGRPLSTLVFTCAAHQEDKIIQYYDPDDPPRCSHGDLMARKTP